MLSTDLDTLRLSTVPMGPCGGVTTLVVFSLPFCGSPPPPASHPYVITCGTGKKYLKSWAIQLASH